MEKKKNKNICNKKKFLIIIISILVIVTIAVIAVMFLKQKETNANDIEIGNLEHINLLKESNEAKAAALIKENIVRITNTINDKNTTVGTGFFIPEGYLITNSHIVDIKGDISIQYYDGTIANAYLYSNSIDNDIAILKVENVPIKALVFGNSNELEVTNDVLSAGFIYNFAGEATISKGILSARRNANNLVYLQSDLSIDTGSSGGPLFNSKAEVIGINTYVTENRTFALTMSSESASMIIDVLIENPYVEYLEASRPKNSINDILLEVGYTKDENYNLYDDDTLIKESVKDNKEDKDKTEQTNKEDNNVTLDKVQPTYYCDSGYSLIGTKCIKRTMYQANRKYGTCKDGYIERENECVKTSVVDAKATYYCTGKLTEQNTCIKTTLQVTGFRTYNARWGSCPKGKECYDLGTNAHTNTLYNKFTSEMVCPVGSTKIGGGTKIVWSNQEYVESNFKVWNSTVPGAIKKTDADGLTYYEDVKNILALCAKSYDEENDVYTTYTLDELKDVACPNGGTLTANNNNQGFYCSLGSKINRYAWDVTCEDTAYSVIQEGSAVHCGIYIDEEFIVNPYYSCPEGSMRDDGKTCQVEETYNRPYNYQCNEGGTLEGFVCTKTSMVDAKKK